MPVQGNLATMSLTEILQWLGNAGKTGTLSIERNKVVKRILVREGRVIACGSNEPSDLLGHFLVSQGRISEETLRQAQLLAEAAGVPIHVDAENARYTRDQTGFPLAGWFSFQPLWDDIVRTDPELFD